MVVIKKLSAFIGNCGFLRNTSYIHILHYNITESGITTAFVRCIFSEVEYTETVACGVENRMWNHTPCEKFKHFSK